jgi:hypothetical protein
MMPKRPKSPRDSASAESMRGSRPSTDANTFIMVAVGILGTLIVSLA